MKKTIIIIAAAVLVLALAIAAVLAVMYFKPEKADDEDCLYPYSFSKRQNDILITVGGDRPEGYEWAIEVPEDSAITAAVSSATDRKTVICVSPVREGYANVTLVLTRNDILPDNRYAISVGFSVSANNKLSVTTYSHMEMQGLRVFGKEEEHTYCFSDNTDRSTLLSVDRLGTRVWSTWSEGDCVSISPLSFENGTARFLMTPNSEGKTLVHIYHPNTGVSLSMEVEVTAERMICIGRCVFDTFNEKQAEIDNHMKELETILGKICLPEEAELTYCGRAAIRLEDGTAFVGGSYGITVNGVEWFFSIFPGAGWDDLLTSCGLTDSDCEPAPVGNLVGKLYVTETEQTMLWVSPEGTAYTLNVPLLDHDAMLGMAKLLYEANPVVNGGNNE